MTSEAVEMSEQVPLKSDTDNKETGDDTQAEETPVKKTESKFKVKKFWMKKDKTTDVTAMPEETKVPPVDGIEEKKKKPMWPPAWLKKPQCTHKCSQECNVNLVNRDEHQTNEHLKLDFGDILAEPDGLHSFDCAWRLTARTFTCVRSIVYKLLALILAIPAAIVFGLLFALATVLNVWCATPLARLFTIPALWLAKTWNFLIRSLLDPLFRSCGLCFSSIHMRRYGFSNDATVEIA